MTTTKRKRNRWDSDSDSDSDSGGGRDGRSGRPPTKRSASASPRRQEAAVDPATTSNAASKAPPERHNFYLFGCRSVDCYARMGKIDEGSYGVVSKARDKVTGEVVALKQVKMDADACREGFPVTALRETNALLALRHPNIVQVREMVVGSTPDKVFMVMDYAEHDLKAVMETKMRAPFLQAEVKSLLRSLLSAVAYMHGRWFIHRDLKTSNLLYDRKGSLKVCDFGLARQYGSPLRGYTQLVVTLWYRAPELLLGAETYATAVDMWSVGCIFAELLLMKPLFPGRGELDQFDRICKLLGAPSDKNWPRAAELPNVAMLRGGGSNKWPRESKLRDKFPLAHATFSGSGCSLSNAGFDLLRRLLALDPAQRISAKDALDHEYFTEAPAPTAPEDMPVFD